DQRADAPAPDFLWEGGSRRHRLQAEEGAKFRWRLGQEVPIPAHDLMRLRLIPEDGAGIDRADRMSAEHETGDDAEITAAAAQAPEEILVLCRIGRHEAPVREHHIGLEQVVDRQAILTRQVSRSTAQRETTDTGCRDDACWHRQAEG